MKNLIATILLVTLFCSCVTQKSCDKKFPAQVYVKDSVVIKDSVVVTAKDSTVILIKDSVVFVQGVSGADSMPCNENSKTTIRRNGDFIQVTIRSGKVYVTYDLQGSLSRFNSVVEQKNKEIYNLRFDSRIAKSSETRVVVSTVKYIPWWAKAACWIVVVLLAYLAIRHAFFKLVG